MKNIREIQSKGLVWMNVGKQGEKELKEIQKRFGFLESDIKESLPPFQRPKIVKRENYYFMVLHFPVFDRVYVINISRLVKSRIERAEILLVAQQVIKLHPRQNGRRGVRGYHRCTRYFDRVRF